MWQCTIVIPGWETGSRTIRRSRRSLGAQPVCRQAGDHPPKKPKSPLYKVLVCQNYPRQIFWIAQNVQPTFSGMARCLLCCNCHPLSLIETRVSPACDRRLHLLGFGDQGEKDEEQILQCVHSSPGFIHFYSSNETSAAFRNTGAFICCGKECKACKNSEKIHNAAGAH